MSGVFCHLCYFCSITTCIFPRHVMFIHLSHSEFQGSQGRGAVFSKNQKRHSMSFGNMTFRMLCSTDWRADFIHGWICALLCGFAKGQAEQTWMFVFCSVNQKREVSCQNAFLGKEWEVWKSHHSAFIHLLNPILKHEIYQIPFCRAGIEASKILLQQAHKQHCEQLAFRWHLWHFVGSGLKVSLTPSLHV